MAKCNCGSETDLYVGDIPVCLDCSQQSTGGNSQPDSLQQKCRHALRIYVDLTEAACELLTHSTRGQSLNLEERAALVELRRDERQALAEYLHARMQIAEELSLEVDSIDRELWLVANA